MAVALIASGVRDGPVLRETSVALLSRGESVRRTGPRRSAGSTKLFYFIAFFARRKPVPAQALVYNSCAKTSVVTNTGRVPRESYPDERRGQAMKVVWIVPRQALKTGGDGVSSDLASLRYRALIPMQGLIARGHDASVVGLDRDCADDVRAQIADADRVVFIKNYTDPVCAETVLEEQRARGVPTWFDLTDDRFEGEASEHLHRMTMLADHVVTVSATLQNIIRQYTRKESAVVGDPYEGPRGAPKWSPDGARVKVLWFGYGTNLPALMKALPGLADAGRRFPMDLRIVTAGAQGIEAYCEKFNRRSGAALTLKYVPWSSAETWDSLAVTDLVLIPAMLDEQWTLAKSANRLVEALWAGRFVIAHPIPSYREFDDCAWLGADLAEGIAWVMHNQESIAGRIRAAQDRIAVAYSPARIAAQWEQILEMA